MKPCATIGCTAPAKDHAHCAACRFMRSRARREGKDPDALSWRQLDAAYWNRREKASA